MYAYSKRKKRASTAAFIFRLAFMDSWNKLRVYKLHTQLIYPLSEWTLITNTDIRDFKRILK